jgi:hypothetical protein
MTNQQRIVLAGAGDQEVFVTRYVSLFTSLMACRLL